MTAPKDIIRRANSGELEAKQRASFSLRAIRLLVQTHLTADSAVKRRIINFSCVASRRHTRNVPLRVPVLVEKGLVKLVQREESEGRRRCGVTFVTRHARRQGRRRRRVIAKDTTFKSNAKMVHAKISVIRRALHRRGKGTRVAVYSAH